MNLLKFRTLKPHLMISGYQPGLIISSLGHTLVQFQRRPATYKPHSTKLPGNIIYKTTCTKIYLLYSIHPSGQTCLVAHLPAVMEWLQHPASPCSLNTSRLHSSDRCLRNMGMCTCLGNRMVPMAAVSEWLSMGIMAKELVPILFTCVTWGNKLCHHSISFQCDSESLVAAIKKKSLLKRCTCNAPPPVFFFFLVFHHALWYSIAATTADHLSRGNLMPAILSYLALSQQLTHSPPSIFHMVSPQDINLTFRHFLQLFQKALSSPYH